MPKYPKLNIGSKNILCKRLGEKLLFVKECKKNFEMLWRDNLKASKPEKNKWVRDCSEGRLGRLLKKIDSKLLKPLDGQLPSFIHGGVSGLLYKKSGIAIPKCPQSAAKSLVDGKKKRWLLHMDLQRFFEQISQEEVINLFHKKLGCDKGVAYILSELCCVQEGQKGSGDLANKKKVIARGFSPSVRLAIWCNMDFFLALDALVKKELFGYSPKLSVFVDDIGISAVAAGKEKLNAVGEKIIALANKYGLVINPGKTKITPPSLSREYVGILLANRKIFPCASTNKKRISCIRDAKESTGARREKIKRSLIGLQQNRKFTKKISLA